MTKEDAERVLYRMEEERLPYCFRGYSDWKEIKDEEFHFLKNKFMTAYEELEAYLEREKELGEED